MKVLLTGASGFVGSHILDRLCTEGLDVRLLLRPTSRQDFIREHLEQVEVCRGGLGELETLRAALEGVTHVIHCAGCTKALKTADYYQVNQHGARQLVQAINRQAGALQRLVLISSLAAGRPATGQSPARELDPASPVSEYGRSKLAAELELQQCQVPFTILRPPAVYGPRDADFFLLFKAARAGVLPLPGGGNQPLSLVYVKDLARAAVHCLTVLAAAGRTYYIASPEIVTGRRLAEEVARQMEVRPWVVPLPMFLVWSYCLVQEMAGHLTGKPRILSRQKYPELKATGWVCDTSRARDELGFTASTDLRAGLAETLAWYRSQHWL